MAIIVYDVALYTCDHFNDWDKCVWRQYLNTLTNINYKDLGYYGSDLNETIAPLNTWLKPEDPPLTPDSFPFVVYNLINTTNPELSTSVFVRTLDDLKNDITLSTYVPIP